MSASGEPTTAAGIPYEGADCTPEEAVEAVKAVRATAARRPPNPGKAECCGATELSGHKPWCITVVHYWRWLLFGWRHHA